MPFLRNAAILATCLLAAGCAHLANRHPARAYADKGHPPSDTAIVACAYQPGYACGIASVDQKSTWNSSSAGKTLWVRVLPGKRQVKLIASNNRIISRPTLTIDDAQPGHVYRIDFADAGKTLTATYKDLGKMDSYTIDIPRLVLAPAQATAHF